MVHRWPALLLLALPLSGLLASCSDSATGAENDTIAITEAPPAAAVPGWPLHDTIQIRLNDDMGAGRADIPVQWSVSKGGGTVMPLDETTNVDGIASALWTLGPAPGINELRVSGGGLAASLQTVGRAFQADRVDAGYGLGCGLVTGALWCWGNDSWVHSPPASGLRPARPVWL
ncbi:MAG TPA: Ig-like domain-containing protein [Gemmatimonadales bacterium]|nr:Ig-like domain-containing protein [Gemmatimonadales bacterium]